MDLREPTMTSWDGFMRTNIDCRRWIYPPKAIAACCVCSQSWGGAAGRYKSETHLDVLSMSVYHLPSKPGFLFLFLCSFSFASAFSCSLENKEIFVKQSSFKGFYYYIFPEMTDAAFTLPLRYASCCSIIFGRSSDNRWNWQISFMLP